jgi:hypothetical protein
MEVILGTRFRISNRRKEREVEKIQGDNLDFKIFEENSRD